MLDLPDNAKRMILGAAYLALRLHDWKSLVFQSEIDMDIKRALVNKMPCGDARSNLMDLAVLLLPDFDRHSPLRIEIKKIEEFIRET